MPRRRTVAFITLHLCLLIAPGCAPGDPDGENPCVDRRRYFETRVWPRVLSASCLGCHGGDGVAARANARLILLPEDVPNAMDINYVTANLAGGVRYEGQSELLLKPTGHLHHGGGAVLGVDSEGYQILSRFLDKAESAAASCGDAADSRQASAASFTPPLPLVDPATTLRRAALDLAGRLPTVDEVAAVDRGGEAALASALESLMREEGFYSRIGEIWNDVLLTNKYIGDPFRLISDTDFPDKYWFNPNQVPWPQLGADQERKRVLTGAGLAAEPLALIEYIVRNNRPFTEIVTAPYTVMTPYSARSYGVDPATLGFVDPTSPTEFRPAAITLTRNGQRIPLPHAGLLTNASFLHRFPNTSTNFNRRRARAVFKAFLATDILEVADRPIDPSSVTTAHPTRDEPACSACHEQVDPVASAFQKWDENGYFTPQLPWPDYLPAPGLALATLPDPGETPAALGWLGRRIAADPRFATAVVQTMWRALSGHDPLDYQPAAAPGLADRIVAWQRQQVVLRSIEGDFVTGGYDLRTVVRRIVLGEAYRAAGTGGARAAWLDGEGVMRLLTPELLSRRIRATTGIPWERRDPALLYLQDWLLGDYNLLYGGIDSDAVTERLVVPNGIMAGIARRMGNDVACAAVPWDFTLPAASRVMFPSVERADRPEDEMGKTLPGLDRIRHTIQALHERLLGERLTLDDPEIDRTLGVFMGTWRELSAAGDPSLPEACQALRDRTTNAWLPANREITADPDYTIRAWMAVLSYLLSDWKFLHG